MEGNRHAVPGLDALLPPHAAASGSTPAPYYFAVGQRLRRPARAGTLIACDDLEATRDGILWRLRTEMDAMFAAPTSTWCRGADGASHSPAARHADH
jgi:hypothetical protein